MMTSKSTTSSSSIPIAAMDYTNKAHMALFYDEQAAQISSQIDEELRAEWLLTREARKNEMKVILLGQAESGKSTLQKQFQLYYASQTLDTERPSWRPVVYFNIIKAIRMILDETDYDHSDSSDSPDAAAAEGVDTPSEVYQAQISAIRLKLLPLVALEGSLATELSGGAAISRGGKMGAFVRKGWQTILSPSSDGPSSMEPVQSDATLLAGQTLESTKKSIEALWRHPAIKTLVKRRRIRLEESAAFFLDNVHRICTPDYLPNTDDILNVRLQTLGVMEHNFPVSLAGVKYQWRLYDVGGARGQRHAWVPYFDDATAIIFLAPISAFDQYLEEDHRINRIDDSLQLFTAICSNKLLKDAHLVLLLNKADLLKKKLAAGSRVQKYITSYGERPNTYENVSEYFRSHFVQAHRRNDPSHRTLYSHFTSMIDIKATRNIIGDVGEAIVRKHIAELGLA